MNSRSSTSQYATFFLGGRIFGLDVHHVQEIVKPLPLSPIPKAPPYVRGLINLRGQIATAICLKRLFGMAGNPVAEPMNIITLCDHTLLSFQVDEVGDVLTLDATEGEPAPPHIGDDLLQFVTWVHKLPDSLLSVIQAAPILKHLNTGLTP